MPDDVLALYAQTTPDATAVIVDEALGGRPSATLVRASSTLQVNRLAHALRDARRAAGRADRLVRPELARGAHHHPRRPQGRAGRGAALVPVQRRRDGLRDRQLRRHPRDRRRRAGADGGRRSATGSRRSARSSCSAATCPAGVPGLGRRARAPSPTPSPSRPTSPRSGRRCSTPRAPPASRRAPCARAPTPRSSARCSASSGLRFGEEIHITTGPLYHSGPLAFASIAHSMGGAIIVLRRFDPTAWLRLVKEHRATNTFSAPTQVKRIVSLPPGELARADLTLDALPHRQRGAGAVRAEAGGVREAGRLVPLRGLRLDRARHRHRDEAARTSSRKPGSCGKPYGGIEIKIVADDGTDALAGRAGRAVHPHRPRDGRLPPHRRAALGARERRTGSRSATSPRSTTRGSCRSATARRT